MSDLARQFELHEAAVRNASAAVDAARATGNASTIASAVATLESAAAARTAFGRQWRAAHINDREYDEMRARDPITRR